MKFRIVEYSHWVGAIGKSIKYFFPQKKYRFWPFWMKIYCPFRLMDNYDEVEKLVAEYKNHLKNKTEIYEI